MSFLATVLAGCNKVPAETPAEPVDGRRLVTIYADSGSIESKTTYANDKTFGWEAGDKISVLFHNSSDENLWVTFEAQSSGTSSAFTAMVDADLTEGAAGEGGSKWAMYPASANHVYTNETTLGFSLEAGQDGNTPKIPMIANVATSSSSTYHFHQLGGAIKFTVNNIRSDVSRLKISLSSLWGTDTRFVSGVFNVTDPATETPSISHDNLRSGGSKFTHVFADVDASHNAVAYMPLPVFDIWPDYCITVSDATSGAILYQKTLGSGAGNINVQRSKITRLNTLTLPNVSASSALIKADGFFGDWASAEGVVSKNYNTGSQPFDLKVVSDGENIWFYHKLYGNKFTLTSNGRISNLSFDLDNKITTGDTGSWWGKGCEYSISYDFYTANARMPRSTFGYVEAQEYNSTSSAWASSSFDASSVVWGAAMDSSDNIMIEWGTTLASLGITPGSTIGIGFVAGSPECTSENQLLSVTIPAAPATP